MENSDCFINNEINYCRVNGYLVVGTGVYDQYKPNALSSTYSGKIRIPSSIENVPVKEISGSAFSRCIYITSVHIEQGITKICDRAFSDCRSLVDIHIPSTIESIGNSAIHFYNYSNSSNFVSTGTCVVYFEANHVLKSIGSVVFAYKENVVLLFENPVHPKIGVNCLYYVSNPKILSPITFKFNGIRSSPKILTKYQRCRSSFSTTFMISLMIIILSPRIN